VPADDDAAAANEPAAANAARATAIAAAFPG
jgi:hypothetical protein